MKDWVQHDDSTIDGLYGESITLIIGFTAGTPVNIGSANYVYPSSTVSIAVSGDDAGVIASKMLGQWTQDGGINMTQNGMGILDAQLSPHDQSAAWFGLELYCSGDEMDGNPLVSTTCSYPSFTLRYYNNVGVLTDELFDQGAATLKLYVVDGG